MRLAICSMIFFLTSCASSSVSVLTSDSYDKEKDITTWMILPYGQVDIPGKWTKSNYLHSSRQQFFKRDSLSLAIALNPCDVYPFYTSDQNDYNFALAFYKWESDYYANDKKLETKLIEKDSVNNFVTWEVINGGVPSIFLFGRKGQISYSLMVTRTSSDLIGAELLKTIYLRK